MENKRGQISIEYLVIVGFITTAVVAFIAIAFLYVAQVGEGIKHKEALDFGDKVIENAQEVFYAGEPSKSTFTAYLPESVENVYFGSTTNGEPETSLIIHIRYKSGLNILAFDLGVPLDYAASGINGACNPESPDESLCASDIGITEGIKKIEVEATADGVRINKVVS